jgi:hypothetical protein
MKDTNSELSFFETLPNRWHESAACLRQAGPLGVLVENYEHGSDRKAPKLLDSAKAENK